MLAFKHLVARTAQFLVRSNRCRRSPRLFRPLQHVLNFSLASGFVVTFNDDENQEDEVKTKVNIAEPQEYSNTFKLQQAANSAVDSSILVLSSSFHTFQFAHQIYVSLLGSAIKALLTSIEVGPVMVERLGIEEHISQLQSEIFNQKQQISDSLYVYNESTKLLNQAANISFLVGNEVSSGLASTHLHNVQQEVLHNFLNCYFGFLIKCSVTYQVDKMKNEATLLETEYLELQMQYIVKSQST